MTRGATAFDSLERQHPEWRPWLAVVRETLREADTPAWDSAVPTDVRGSGTATPLLARATLEIDERMVQRLLERLLRVGSRSGTREMASLKSVLSAHLDVLRLFRASLREDNAPATEAAASCGADEGALHAINALVCVPFLHACNRHWARSVSPGWLEGYCPLCGSWPAFAETRGIERTRFFRCGRCGGAWHARPLRCPYCGVDEHTALVALTTENAGLNAVIDGCNSCLGYVKTFTRLQGCPPGMVMLDDLASVHLDIAALDHGYRRPTGAGHLLDVTVTGRAAPHRFFG